MLADQASPRLVGLRLRMAELGWERINYSHDSVFRVTAMGIFTPVNRRRKSEISLRLRLEVQDPDTTRWTGASC